MLSICCINAKELKNQVKNFNLCKEPNTLTNIDLGEIQNHFRIRRNDTFLVLKYTGELNGLSRELDHINFPTKSFGQLLIINGNKELSIDTIVNLQSIIEGKFHTEEWNPLLAWFLDDKNDSMEFMLVTKVFEAKELLKDEHFRSLWDAVVSDLNVAGNKGSYDCLRDVNWCIIGNTLELYMQGDARKSFVLSLKKQEIEKSIYEYTGEKLFVKIR